MSFAVSPLAELTAMLHALAATEHHPHLAAWAAGVRAGLRPELAERLLEAEFLWRSSRADFLLPARPCETLTGELDDVDRIADAAARRCALDQAQARGALQEAVAERLLADPRAVRARVREALEQCGPAFFDAAWPGVAARITADLRVKTDLRDRQGRGAAVAAVSGAVALAPEGDRIVVDKLQDNTTSAAGARVTFILAVFGSPHLVTVHAPGWRPVVQYPVAEPSAAQPVSLDAVGRRLGALAHPVRLRLVRTLAPARTPPASWRSPGT